MHRNRQNRPDKTNRINDRSIKNSDLPSSFVPEPYIVFLLQPPGAKNSMIVQQRSKTGQKNNRKIHL
jgi:hypothetical protein